MVKVISTKYAFFLLLFILVSCDKEIIELKLEKTKYGSLQKNEYDYYKLTLPKEIEKYNNLIIELEPNKELDIVSNIISDPDLYVSKSEKYPNESKHTWSSKRFGDETVSINRNLLEPKDVFYLGVHCKDKCNYIIKSKLAKSIPILENKKNIYELDSNTVMKFSFRTREKFNNLLINLVGSYINSFKVYLAKKDASSSNTLPSIPILFNGYQFIIKNDKDKYSGYIFELIVDNEKDKQELSIWLKYDNNTIKVNEAEIIYESIQENGASCYNFTIENANKENEIILSTILFNGYGFIYINGFNQIDSSKINSEYKNKEESYQIYQNKVIKLSKEEFKKYENNKKEGGDSTLNFCFYAEANTSFSMKIYYLDNYKKLQLSNIIYPGIGIEDIIPKKSVTKYKMEHFDVENDLYIYLEPKQGKTKLFLYIANPLEANYGIDKYSLELLKKTNEMIEAQTFNYGYYLVYSKEANKCVKKKKSDSYKCYLYAIVECESNDDCIYSINFDHSKTEIKMHPKETYSDVISEGENDYYSISITDPSVKNIAIVLTQNTGKTVLKLDYFNTKDDNIDIRKEIKNNEFLPNIIKLSCKDFKKENLIGILSLKVKGLSFASYSLYYYSFNEEEKLDYLDYDKVSMKLEKGKIIQDIFIDDHIFKVYLYDSSTNINKTNLYITLVETDYVDSELYVFKDLNDFTMSEGTIVGYLWKGEYKDYIYIDKNDTNYLENDILYIMIYKKTKKIDLNKNNGYSTFYLGVTDENTPFLLNEAIEFMHQLNKQHNSQKFLYYYLDNEDDLQISFSIYYGHILLNIYIGDFFYAKRNITTESQLIYIKKSEILKFCKEQKECPILIEVQNDIDYSNLSTFLISIRNTKDVPINLKQGVVNKRTILSGEDQHFIIDLKPDKAFGAKITAFFSNGQAILYARKLLKNELYKTFVFPDENNYEYSISYLMSNKGFYIIEIPYEEISDLNPCKILLTVRGIFPGLLSTKIEYVLSVSNTINEIVPDKNYKLFISKGEIAFYHFKAMKNKKRLYISMTNKDQDANMYLTYDKYISNLFDYQWKNTGSYNEYLDLSIDDPYFVQRGMTYLDGDYYLAIQGLGDTFFNLYICSENIKIITINSDDPSGCSCESDKDKCYFRYENINNLETKTVLDQKLIFYTEYTYGRGELYGKLYPNGNMDEIINDLPSKDNHKYYSFNFDEFLIVKLSEGQTNYTFSSVLVLAVECKEKSLFDLSAVHLDKTTDLSMKDRNLIFIKLNQDNIFYLSKTIGISSKFIYYISKKEDLNFQIKSLLGKADIHVYINDTETDYKFSDDKEREMSKENYFHVSDFNVDNYYDEKKNYYGKVLKEYGYKNYLYFEVKPVEDCLINIILNYDNEMFKIPLNKEVIGVVKNFNYYGYFDFLSETEEVIVTLTSLEKKANFNIFLKVNIINRNIKNEENKKYSMASSKNYDLKGTTNPLTSAVSFKIKNVPKDFQKESMITRILINVYSDIYKSDQKIKILVTPVINNINRIKPEQKLYYFSAIENIKTDKTLFLLKNRNKENNLMIIEISSCKGNFEYTLTDFPPLGTETYTNLKQKEIKSNIYSFNGKKIIVIRNCEMKEYYLMIFGKKNKLDFFIDENDENNEPVDILFYYYTIKENEFKYLATPDSMIYDIENNYKSIIVKLPELRNRDIFGKENNISDLNFTVIISNDKNDFDYMESTCYLTKLKQKREIKNEFNYLNVEINQENKIIKISGFNIGETYYINILAKNELTGEIITYRPIIMNTYAEIKTAKIVVIVILSILILVFLYIAFYVYRKYRIQKSQLEEQTNEKKPKDSIIKKLKNLSKINLNIFKKKYNDLKEDKIELSDKNK